jgi:hypothetical protein
VFGSASETPPVFHRLSAARARFMPGVMHRNIPGFSQLCPHDRTTNAPASPSNHQPVFHRLSTDLSTGCTRHCEEPTGPAFGGARWRAMTVSLSCEIIEQIQQICPTGKSLLIFRNRVKPLSQKYFASRLTQIRCISPDVLFRQEGRCARHETRGGMRWTRRRQARK